MKIGIDAKWFYEGPPSGRVVIRNLIKHLFEISNDDEFYIFLDEKEYDRKFPYQKDNIHPVYVWAGNNMLSNVFVIPFMSWSLHLDIVIYQNFSPFISNSKRYAYIHDVLFYTHPEFYTKIERLYLSPLKLLAKFSHRLCTVSSTEKQRMIESGYGKHNNIDVVYHGVDEVFKPAEYHPATKLQSVVSKYNLPERFILYVGRLNVRKNVFNLLRSIALLKDNTIPLVVVGGYDWKMDNVDSLLDEQKIRNRIIFTGPVYGDDLAYIYSLAKVFCFVSYAESFGLPVIEGMASGVPVVVSDRTCLPEICADAALFANPDSPADIAKQIDLLLEDNALCVKLRKLGLTRAQQFTWEKSAETLLQSVYKAVRIGDE